MSERYRRHHDRGYRRSRSRSRYIERHQKRHRYREDTRSPSRSYRKYRRRSRSRSGYRRKDSYDRRDSRNYSRVRKHKSSYSISSISPSEERSQLSERASSADRNKSSNSDENSGSSSSENPHYKFKKNEIIGKKYRVTKLLGDGTFGRVVEAEYKGELFAVKIIKAVPRYIDSAKTQKSIIRYLNNKDKDDRWGLVRYVDSFNHYSNYCIVFKPLGMSLYEVLKKNDYVGYPMQLVQVLFQQTLRTVGFIHSVGYTHTDLKPENILFEERQMTRTVWEFNGKYVEKELPSRNTVRIIDFGGATEETEHHSKIVNTRQYRAPEVILGCCRWSHSSDVWSIGCIVVQLLTGNLYFPTHEDAQHLRMIEKHYGRLPFWMTNGSQQFRHLFSKETGRMKWPRVASSQLSIQRVNQMRTLPALLPNSRELVDLLCACLQVDPQKRITCTDALKHPFFRLRLV